MIRNTDSHNLVFFARKYDGWASGSCSEGEKKPEAFTQLIGTAKKAIGA